MKRLLCIAMTVLMLLPVFATTAFASGHGHGNGHGKHAQVASQHCTINQASKYNQICVINGTCANNCQYTDENGDNICDNCKNRCADCGETKDENADGICDDCGKCSHYADENNDGVCDHQANCENRKNAACKTVHRNSTHHGGKHRNHH